MQILVALFASQNWSSVALKLVVINDSDLSSLRTLVHQLTLSLFHM